MVFPPKLSTVVHCLVHGTMFDNLPPLPLLSDQPRQVWVPATPAHCKSTNYTMAAQRTSSQRDSQIGLTTPQIKFQISEIKQI